MKSTRRTRGLHGCCTTAAGRATSWQYQFPKTSLKEYFFKRKLILFNETFAPMGEKKDQETLVVLWHEGKAGRRDFNIVTAYYHFMLALIAANEGKKTLTIFGDNCAAQNMNCTI